MQQRHCQVQPHPVSYPVSYLLTTCDSLVRAFVKEIVCKMADIGVENGEYSSRQDDYDAEEAEERECDDDENEDDESSQNNFGPPHSGSGGPDGPGLLGPPGSYGGPNFGPLGPSGPWGRGFPPRGPRYGA